MKNKQNIFGRLKFRLKMAGDDLLEETTNRKRVTKHPRQKHKWKFNLVFSMVLDWLKIDLVEKLVFILSESK